MFVTGRAALAAAAVLVLAAGCSSKADDPVPEPTGTIDATTMRGALMQANEIGPTWTTPDDSAANDPNKLVSICGGTSAAPAVPPGGTVVTANFVDEGDTGAQTLEQTALVYPDKTAAMAAQTGLRAIAEGCPATVSVAQSVTSDKSEPAYTETVQVQPLSQGNWSGFVVLRHKQYEPKHPGTADTAVAILSDRNVTLVDAYAIYRLNTASANPNFTSDWGKLVGTVVQRAG